VSKEKKPERNIALEAHHDNSRKQLGENEKKMKSQRREEMKASESQTRLHTEERKTVERLTHCQAEADHSPLSEAALCH